MLESFKLTLVASNTYRQIARQTSTTPFQKQKYLFIHLYTSFIKIDTIEGGGAYIQEVASLNFAS